MTCEECEVYDPELPALLTRVDRIACEVLGHAPGPWTSDTYKGEGYRWRHCRRCGELLAGTVPDLDIAELLRREAESCNERMRLMLNRTLTDIRDPDLVGDR